MGKWNFTVLCGIVPDGGFCIPGFEGRKFFYLAQGYGVFPLSGFFYRRSRRGTAGRFDTEF